MSDIELQFWNLFIQVGSIIVATNLINAAIKEIRK